MVKRSLVFLFIIVLSAVSMLSNVFAGGNNYWTCIEEKNSPYSVGDTISHIYDAENIESKNDTTSYAAFKSNFEVKSGDRLSVYMESYLVGLEEYMDQAASYNWITVQNDKGKVICNIDYELSYKTQFSKSTSVVITDETAGKLTVTIGLEGTGNKNIDVEIGTINFELNDSEI